MEVDTMKEKEDLEEDLKEEEHFEGSDTSENFRNSGDSDEPDYLQDSKDFDPSNY